MSVTTYTFRSRRAGHERRSVLSLLWQVDYSAISENYDAEDYSAQGVWDRWIAKHGAAELNIDWYVVGASMIECAPFVDHHGCGSDFLTYFTWPTDDAGRRLRWTDLPVLDLRWTPGDEPPSGFIQQATGWKPSPLQPTMPVAVIATACGLSGPRR